MSTASHTFSRDHSTTASTTLRPKWILGTQDPLQASGKEYPIISTLSLYGVMDIPTFSKETSITGLIAMIVGLTLDIPNRFFSGGECCISLDHRRSMFYIKYNTK